MRLSRPTLSVLGSAVALASSVGCRPAPARRAPPSPLLDALGLAPPALSDPRCRRERVHWRWSWHGMLTALTGRAGITCWLHERAGTAADGTAKRNVARVSLDPDGVVYNASRSAYGLRAAEAAAAADSVLARGWRLPGVRPVACAPARDADGRPVPVRGWEAPAYTAVVQVLHAQPQAAAGYSWEVTVGRGRLQGCVADVAATVT